MTQKFTGRKARQEDANAIVRVQRKAVDKAWRPLIDDFDTFLREKFDTAEQTKKYHERIAGGERIIIVVENDAHEVVGFASARKHEANEQPLAYDYQATAFYIDPPFEGSGASTVLLSQLFIELTRHGVKNVCGWCLADNRLARNFYERRGGKLIADAVAPPEYSIAPHVVYGWTL